MHDNFITPIQNAFEQTNEILTRDEFEMVFQNIDVIFFFHGELMEKIGELQNQFKKKEKKTEQPKEEEKNSATENQNTETTGKPEEKKREKKGEKKARKKKEKKGKFQNLLIPNLTSLSFDFKTFPWKNNCKSFFI